MLFNDRQLNIRDTLFTRGIKLVLLTVLFSIEYAKGQNQLDKYVQIALDNNQGLKSIYSQYLASEEQVKQSGVLPDPNISIGTFVQPVETRLGPQRATLGIQQSFPWFGTLKAQNNASKNISNSILQQYESAKNSLKYEVKSSYNELYYINKAILITSKSLDLLRSFKELARISFESSETAFVDVIRLEMEEKELVIQLEHLQDKRIAEQSQFESLTGQSIDAPIMFPNQLSVEIIQKEVDQLFDSLVQSNPALKELRWKSKAQQERAKLAQLNGMPSFNVGATYINIGSSENIVNSDNGRDALLLPQIGLNIPLNRKKYDSKKTQYKLLTESVDLAIADKENQYYAELQSLIIEHRDALRRTKTYEGLHQMANQTTSLLQTEFTTGKTDLEEVLRMERKTLEFQLASEKARIDNNNAVYKINYLLGI